MNLCPMYAYNLLNESRQYICMLYNSRDYDLKSSNNTTTTTTKT